MEERNRPPFSLEEVVDAAALGQDAVTAVLLHADRLMVGTDKGALLVFDLVSLGTNSASARAPLVSRHDGFAKKAVDQLGMLPASSTLLALAGGDVNIYAFPALTPISTLASHTKAVCSLFYILPSSTPSLALACRRKLLLLPLSATHTPLTPTELALPHQIRGLAATSPERLVAGFSTGEYGTITLSTSSPPVLGDLFAPSVEKTTIGRSGLGGLAKATGLGAFVGQQKVDKNDVVLVPKAGKKSDQWIWGKNAGWTDQTPEGDVLLVRENSALPYSTAGKFRPGITFPSVVEETVVLPPYIISLLASPPPSTASTLQIHALPSLSPIQTIPLSTPAQLLTVSSESPDRPTVLVTGAVGQQKVMMVKMRSWTSIVEGYIAVGQSAVATSLLRSAGSISLPPPLLRRLSTLRAYSLFQSESYEPATDGFITLDISPARVVALYPSSIAGKLLVAPQAREALFGGRSEATVVQQNEDKEKEEEEKKKKEDEMDAEDSEAREGSVRGTPSRLMGGATHWLKDSPTRASPKEEVSTPPRDKSDPKKEAARLRRSVDALIRYLTDRRQKCSLALSSLPSASSMRPTPSTLSPSSPALLLDLPDASPSTLGPEQLARAAQVVDTALFRAYLATRPVMVGPLCRIENWCEVEEVEELLVGAQKFGELLDLYNGKQMHDRAVKLLRQMAEEEDDVDEKVGPTVRYLQKLGAEHVDLIFKSSEWVFDVHRSAGLDIFIADLEEVESLPRHATMHHLERIGTDLCAKYLEHIIHHLGEEGSEFHEKLIEIYLGEVHDDPKAEATNQKLLDFLESSTSYRADRILGRLPSDDMYRVRAIILGRLGRHEGALQIYIYQLDDHATAEEYCRRVYDADPSMRSTIFHLLLRIYLRPRPHHPMLFAPALSLISAHASSIGAIEVFELLPPLVAVSDLRVFLHKTLRRSGESAREAKVLKAVGRSGVEVEERRVADLEERRVKITESRVCPQCHKRLGNSVIAIHSPLGEVTHYQCREDFIASKQV